jgi:WD40 repeat protein/uncharacterized caspase-like protein
MTQTANSRSNSVFIAVVFLVASSFLLAAYSSDVCAQAGATHFTESIGFTHEKRANGIERTSDVSRLPSERTREAKPELVLQTAENNFGVTRLIFSPDGRLLATTSARSSVVKLWETATGRDLRNLSSGSQSSPTTSPFVAFSPDSRLIATSAENRSIKIWDVTSGREVQTLSGLRDSTLSGEMLLLEFSRDNQTLTAIIHANGGLVANVWETSSWRLLRTVEIASLFGLPDEEIAVALNTNSDQLAAVVTGKSRALISIFELTKGRQLESFSLSNKRIYSASPSFTGDGHLLVSAIEENRWKLWHTWPDKHNQVLASTTDEHGSIQFSHDGRFVALGQDDSVKVCDVSKGRIVRSLKVPTQRVGATEFRTLITFSDDGRTIATASLGSPTVIWEMKTGKQLLKVSGRANAAYAVGFKEDGTRLFSGGRTSWDLRTGRGLRLLNGLADEMLSLPSADGRFVAAFLPHTSRVAIFDTSNGRQVQTLSPALSTGAVQRVKFSRDGSLLMATYSTEERTGSGIRQNAQHPKMSGTELRIWDVKSGSELHCIDLGNPIVDEAFSVNGRVLATLNGMGQIALWNTTTGNPIVHNFDANARFTSLTLSHDDGTLATGGLGEIKLWDVTSGRQIGILKGGAKPITNLAFSRDGLLLAASREDNSISIWDTKTGGELRTLVGHTGNINSIDFSPDTKLLAAASDDGSTFLWDTATGEHILSLISLDDGGEWITVTPQGMFDGTPISWNQILWRYNQDTFNVAPIEWFFNEFYYPGLLADVFAGKRPRVRDDVSTKDRRQPVLKLSLAFEQQQPIGLREVKVKIKVIDAPADKDNPSGCGARDLRLFRNGSLVKVWHGDVLNGQSAVTLEEEVTLIAGVNRLTAYAFNRDNVKSKDAQLSLTGADSLKRSGTTYIIAVGLNEYANPQYNLKYAVADAQSFSRELQAKVSQVSPTQRVEIVPLINHYATKANILAALERLAGIEEPSTETSPDLKRLKRAVPEDTIVIYFAGHGTAQGKRFYLIPHDLGYNGQRIDLNEQALQTILNHSISDIELEQALEGVQANRLLLFIDACNSGQALEAAEKRRGPMNSKGLAQLAYEKGMYILTAAQSYQAALEAAQLGHGLLTYALVEEGLKTERADTEPRDGVLTAREWLDFATERVPQLQEDKIKESRGLGLEIAFTEGEQDIADPSRHTLQRPRAFYRRELESNPLVIAREKTNLISPLSITTPNSQVPTSGLKRWFDLQAATLVTRYRWIQSSAGTTVANQIQDQMQFKGRFKFDRNGSYSLNAGVFTGSNFTAGFNDTGIGTGDAVTNLYLKQLYLSAKPVNGVEVQFGGLYFQRGESTEITTYDNDGYLTGERVVIQRPQKFFFDEISVTFGFVGDLFTPNINKRWHRLKKSNYHQFLLGKKIGERAAVSGDYTFESGRDTLRQAFRVNTPELKAIDFFRLEVYERLENNPKAGLAAYVEKGLINKSLAVGGGYAQIDPQFGGLNADRFNRGRRFFLNGSYRLSPEFTISTFYTHAFKNDFPIVNHNRFEVVFTYNLLKTLQKTKLF